MSLCQLLDFKLTANFNGHLPDITFVLALYAYAHAGVACMFLHDQKT